MRSACQVVESVFCLKMLDWLCGLQWDSPWKCFSHMGGRYGSHAVWKGLRICKKAQTYPLRGPLDLSRWVFNFDWM